MAKITAEDVAIWLFIAATLIIIIWKMFGSPSDLAIIITTGLFIIGLISALTKKVYDVENKTSSVFHSLDKKTELSFVNTRNDLNIIRNDINHIKDDINEIKTLLKRKRK